MRASPSARHSQALRDGSGPSQRAGRGKKSIQQQLSQSKTEHRIVSSQNPLSGQLHSRRGPSFRDNRLATHDFNGRRLSAVTAVCQLAALVAGSFAREGRRKVASGKAPSEPAIVAALSACSCGRIVEIDRSRSGGHDWSRVGGSAQGAVRVAPDRMWIFMSNECMRVLRHCRCRCRIFCN